jgi:hypothetical protein
MAVAQDDFTLVVESNIGMKARDFVVRQHDLTIRRVTAND